MRRSRVQRSHQVLRLLGEESTRRPVVLVIDDAHVLHRQTVRALKRLRELEWLRRSPLLGVVLIAQQDPTHSVDEVRLRSDRLWLEGLTRAEAKRALESALGSVVEPQAAGLVSKHSGARNWLGLIEAADRCLAAAAGQGRSAHRRPKPSAMHSVRPRTRPKRSGPPTGAQSAITCAGRPHERHR